MWLTLNIHCSAPVPTQTTGGCLALGSFIKKTGPKSENKILKIEKSDFRTMAIKVKWYSVIFLKCSLFIFS